MNENPQDSSPDEPESRESYLLPNYTQWFNLTTVNAIEKECVPNIFLGYSKNSNAMMEEYRRIRNKIISLYRSEPDYYLTVTYCVRRLAYDASIIMKIHSFLNYWGIINYQVVNANGDRLNKRRIKEETLELRGVHSHSTSKKSKRSDLGRKKKKVGKTKHNYLSPVQEAISRNLDGNPPTDENIDYPMCCGCNWECKSSYYVLGPDTIGEVVPQVMTRGVWCTSCYCNSNYPITFNKDYFVRIDIPPKFPEKLLNVCQTRYFDESSESSSSTVKGKGNSDQTREDKGQEKVLTEEEEERRREEAQNLEYEKLYEAIRKYGTDWQSVAQHLGDDITPNEVIFQFINAPLEREVITNLKLTNYMEPSVYDMIPPNFPFLDSPNTIISLLSFCASVISPVVASSAAKAAFDTILNCLKNLSSIPDLVVIITLELNKGEDPNSEEAENKEDDQGNDKAQKDMDSKESKAAGDKSESKEGNPQREQRPGSEAREAETSDKEENFELSQEEDLEDGENKQKPIERYINKMILQRAAHAALEAARERSAELASQENHLLKQALPKLISLKIGRIKEKLKIYNQTQDKLNRKRLRMSKRALRILECKFNRFKNPKAVKQTGMKPKSGEGQSVSRSYAVK